MRGRLRARCLIYTRKVFKRRRGMAGMVDAQESGADEGQAPKEMYTDDEIRRWEPLMPLDRDRLTPKQIEIIMDNMYKRSFIVYDRLAEL